MRKNPEVSVVVCTRDRPEHLKKCLTSLFKQSCMPKEIIIVDDFSEHGMNVYEFLRKEIYHFISTKIRTGNIKVVVLKNKRAFGIAYSRNLGIKIASGDVIAFLDDDSFAHKNWIRNLIRNYRDDRVAGVGGPFIELGRKNLKTPTKPVKRLAYVSPKQGKLVIHYRIKRIKDAKLLPKTSVPFLLGGNMSFRRNVLLSIKGVDVRFAGNGYHEETDMGMRASRIGKIIFEPMAITYHDTAKKGGNREVIKFDIDRFLYYMLRNSVLLFFKNFQFEKSTKCIWNLMKRQVRLIMKGETGLSRDFLKIKNRMSSIFYSVAGCLSGIYLWFKTRKDDITFSFSQPASIQMYKIVILSSSVRIVDFENRTHVIKKMLGL